MTHQLELRAAPAEPRAWNPYWLAFARAHGRDPATPGMACDFILWMSQRWQEWRRQNGRGPHERLRPEDHAAFAAELAERHPVALPAA